MLGEFHAFRDVVTLLNFAKIVKKDGKMKKFRLFDLIPDL